MATLGQDYEEEEGSEYSYEYETDSEYEYEEEAKAEVTESIKIAAAPPPVAAPPPPVEEQKEEQDEGRGEEGAKSEDEIRNHREQLEKFKPKLPAYVTTPEPCAFSEDPGRWITWMEGEVTREKERRCRELELAQEEQDRENREREEEEERLRQEKETEEAKAQAEKEEEEARVQRVKDEEEDRLAKEMREAEEELERTAAEEEKRLKELKEKEVVLVNPAMISCIYKEENPEELVDNGDEEGSEWEYETESEAEAETDAATAESAIPKFTTDDFVEKCVQSDDDCVGKSDDMSVDVAVNDTEGGGSHPDRDICDNSKLELKENVSQKAATHGHTAGGENPAGDRSKVLDGSLDPETQRKLDFVRKKKAEQANRTKMAKTGIEEIQAQNDKMQHKKRDITGDSMDCLDEATRSKLEFIRRKKASAPCQSSGSGDEVKSAGFMRQQSCPERPTRPSSIAASNDGNLDDMLARIKVLRAERKQILHDMSAIKNAFDTPEKESSSGDDGIDSAGDCTPVGEHGAPFHGPSAASLSRQGRRSVDSGIGSKSMCSVADGSPTAELESIHEGSESHGGRKKISHEEREGDGEGDIHCFICGENLGRLSKGAVMHMGLEDGEPVCADALYLTDESKEKIRNIASTKMFTYEAKYGLLQTVDLEIYDIDFGIPAEDVMDKVDAFLIDVEKQKQLDKEKFDAMRSGAIDEILMEEFKDIMEPQASEDMDMDYTPPPRPKYVFSAATQALLEGRSPPPPPPRADKHLAPPPPPPPPPMEEDGTTPCISSLPPPSPALSSVLNSIKSGQIPHLRHAETHETSMEGVGQVIHRHIAPRAFTKDVRALVNDIRGDKKKSLKKVKTMDKSKPFIPDDIEIYFYGGTNTDKKAPPPPLSKQPVNSSRKRAGKEGG